MSRRWRSFVPSILSLSLVVAGVAPANAVDWPVSDGLVVGEVVTGGARGADEYIELYNAATSARPLAGLELVYASASGQSVTRKQAWSEGQVPAGGRILLANADGSFATVADHAYSGGLSADGGSVVLRAQGGEVVDALSWGTAMSAFVEGSVATAPSAGSSLERLPGDGAGNGRDTNDNAADTRINASPLPEGRSGGPVATPTPAPTPQPTPEPTPQATPQPTPQPTPTAPSPTPQPTPTEPSPTPTPTTVPQPTPQPTLAPTPAPTAEPTPPPSQVLDIAAARARAVGSAVSVEGTVTVQAGRILGERTLVVQDATAGIPVRLPSMELVDHFPRGTILRASGKLAQPYDNLELRADDPADLVALGTAGLPDPVSLGTSGLTESNEGTLATLTATIISVDAHDSGAVSIVVADAEGEGRVYAFAPVGLVPGSIERDQRVRASGIVGQRASGSNDGYRLWLRGEGDLVVAADAPTPVPTDAPGGGNDDSSETEAPRVRIADAAEGQTVTIVGAVTSKAGLLDSEGRRVTVQDGSGAILVRYPADTTPARVGSVIRAIGEVGTWFGSRQLEADEKPIRRRSRSVQPTTLRHPPQASDEWRLVRVAVLVTDIERSGDTWRAEGTLGGGETSPIVGLAGSGIDGDLLEPGRLARVTGLVKRAHPSATDQRFAVAPRSRRDIRLGRLRTGDDEDAGDRGDHQRDVSLVTTDVGETVLATTFGALLGLEGRVVRVGGRVETIGQRRLTLDDGTGRGTLRLTQAMETIDPALEVGEVVNAVGRVVRRRDRSAEVVVDSAADLRRAATTGVGVTQPTRPVLAVVGPGAPESEVETNGSHPSSPPDDVTWVLLGITVIGLLSCVLIVAAGLLAWRLSRDGGGQSA